MSLSDGVRLTSRTLNMQSSGYWGVHSSLGSDYHPLLNADTNPDVLLEVRGRDYCCIC